MIVVWIVLTLVGGVAAGKLSTRWYQSTAIPGKPAYEGSLRTLKALGAGVRPPNVVVFHSSSVDVTKSPAVRAAMARVVKANPRALTSSYFSTGNAMYASRDRHTTFLQVYLPGPDRLDVKSGAAKMRAVGGSRASGRDHRQRDRVRAARGGDQARLERRLERPAGGADRRARRAR